MTPDFMVSKKDTGARGPRLLLVSTSPRQRALLQEAGIPFEAVAPRDTAEDFSPGESPRDLVLRHALAEGRSVAAVEERVATY
jgi:predicted house-cleaning NTP pyrophosphatase (Maf/HAM1 superfamily)